MNAGLLFLPGVVVVGFVLLFATTLLERLIVPPVQPLHVPTGARLRVTVEHHDRRTPSVRPLAK